MHYRLTALCFIALTTLITACAPMTMPEQLAASDYQGQTALLVGTYAHTRGVEKYDVESIWFQNIETEEYYRIHTQNAFDLFTAQTDYTILDKNSEGFVFAFKIPAGKYRIRSAVLSEDNMQYRGYDVFNSEFIVESGKPNYLGEVKTHVLEGENFLGMTVTRGAVFMVSNKLERDLLFISQKYPEINWKLAKVVTPKSNTKDQNVHIVGKF